MEYCSNCGSGRPTLCADCEKCDEDAIASLKAERDQLRVDNNAVQYKLGNLLAVIHGDGGHYQHEHGDAKAVIDGMEKVNNSFQRAEAAEATAKEQAAHIAELRAALGTIDKELNTIAEGKLEEAKNDRTSAEAYGFGYAADYASQIIASALSSTPTTSLAKLKAEVLRDIARTIYQETDSEIARCIIELIHEKADEAEKGGA